MPIYEYRCRECAATFEALRSMGDNGRGLTCPECGATRPEKLLSTFAAHGGGAAAGPSSGPSGGGCCGGSCGCAH